MYAFLSRQAVLAPRSGRTNTDAGFAGRMSSVSIYGRNMGRVLRFSPRCFCLEPVSRPEFTAVDGGLLFFHTGSDSAGSPAQLGVGAQRKHHGGSHRGRPQG